ncbi:sensor domain-containing protein [Amycolatopsis sp.]|jgi:diguanylate cyclase (GGDEF)-like protein/PAS domain S-box-containing protein|uniref:sensor domain-containing protein n=1 Tax=Amycolatopsis sp. TaxID=37632 RepID=UPI002E05E153|nr:EAL domain-containing protein [Amycolatopsis sp.]
MEADALGVKGPADINAATITSALGYELIADLALSVDSAVIWAVDFAHGTLSWMPGLGDLLGIPASSSRKIERLLANLIAPLTQSARDAPPWQDFELEQAFESPPGERRWLRLSARTYANERGRGLLGIATDITRRHADRQDLADMADRYRLLVELSPDAICVHENGILKYVNPAAVRFIKANSPADVLGIPITDFVDPLSVPGMKQRITSLTTPGAVSEPAELLLTQFGGSTLVVETVSVRTTWEGRPAFQVIMRDVTAQKTAEAALHYQVALVGHVSDAIIGTSADGVVHSWNPAAEAVYGVPAADVLGRPVSEVVGASLDPKSILQTGGVVQSIHRRSDGSALAIRVSAAEMAGGYVLLCADETARRRAEQHYSTVVAFVDEGIVVIGPTGLIESANPAAQRILGMSEDELLGLLSTVLELYDEEGKRIPPHSYPSPEARDHNNPSTRRVLRVRRPDGQNVWLSLTARLLNPDDTGPASVVTSFTDITERRAIGERLAHEATHDPLTELANRTLVLNRLSAALRRPERASMTTVLFIDLDKFKVINDSLGHNVGDKVLRIAGERLRRGVRQGDVVGRLGGDEFVVVSVDFTEPSEVRALAGHLREYLTEPIVINGRQLHVDASIGIVMAGPDDDRVAEDLLRDADVAMYQAKTRGRGRYEFFDVELRMRMQRRLSLEQDLRDALQNGQLWTAYQPIVDLKSGHMVAVEALLRWNHPVHGSISPVEFIPLAEESDLINLIGTHMLRTTTRELTERRAKHGLDLHLKVNLSVRQLDDPRLVPAVQDALDMTGLPAGALCLEVTESALMRDQAAAIEVLTELRGLGVGLAIDDFGTGYSSLAQLQRLTLDTLKIDRSFITPLGESKDAEAIVNSIIVMAHAVDLVVVAEGVETARQLEILKELNCDQAQGFYLGRPTAAEDLFPLITPNHPWPRPGK